MKIVVFFYKQDSIFHVQSLGINSPVKKKVNIFLEIFRLEDITHFVPF